MGKRGALRSHVGIDVRELAEGTWQHVEARVEGMCVLRGALACVGRLVYCDRGTYTPGQK